MHSTLCDMHPTLNDCVACTALLDRRSCLSGLVAPTAPSSSSNASSSRGAQTCVLAAVTWSVLRPLA
jgi:hypothetical protein